MSVDFYPAVAAPSVSLSDYASGIIVNNAKALVDALNAASGQNYSKLIRAITSESYSQDWGNAGSLVSPGRYWTASISESRNAAGVCTLSQVLQGEVSSKYFLSARAAAGILRRAERRGKTLPPPLEAALVALASQNQDGATKTT